MEVVLAILSVGASRGLRYNMMFMRYHILSKHLPRGFFVRYHIFDERLLSGECALPCGVFAHFFDPYASQIIYVFAADSPSYLRFVHPAKTKQ